MVGSRLILGLGVVSFLAAMAGAQTPAPSWTFAGPAAITSAAIGGQPMAGAVAAVAAGSPGTPVAIAGLGGVWSDSTGTWEPLTDTQPSTWVSALALAGNALYAGTGDVNGFAGGGHAGTGILETTDGGLAWSLIGAQPFAGLAVTRIGVDSNNPLHLLAAAVAMPDSPSGAVPGLYSSTDDGVTWQLRVSGGVWDFGWNPAQGVVVAAGAAALYRSADNGTTFTQVTAGAMPAAWGRAAVAFEAATGGFLALFSDVTGNTATVVNGTSAGTIWQALTPPAGLFSSGSGLRALALAADPRDSTHFWLGGFDLWETRNGGQSFTNLTHAAQPGAAVYSNQHVIAAGSDGSLWLGNDGGVWSAPSSAVGAGTGVLANRNQGLVTAALLSVAVPASGSGGNVAAGLTADGAVTGASGAAFWTASAASSAMDDVVAVAGDPASPARLYAASANAAALWASSDGGSTWTGVGAVGPVQDAALAPVVVPLAVDPGGSGALYCGTTRLWKSADQGATWSALSTSLPGGAAAIALSAANPSLIWLAAAGGALARSNDGGSTWTSIAPPLTGGTIADLALDSSDGEVWLAYSATPAAGEADVWTSLNGGATWTSAGSITGGVRHLRLDPIRSGVAAAAGTQVNFTLDNGASWSALTSQLPGAPIGALAFDATETLWAATLGRGLWNVNLTQAALAIAFDPAPPQSVAAGGTAVFAVQVTSLGQPVAGVPIAWSADLGNWTASSVTAANGIATVNYTASDTAGSVAITAVAGGGSSNVEATANFAIATGAVVQLEVVSGAQQAQTVGTKLNPITVAALDAFSNPVPNLAVTLSDGGAGGAFSANPVTTAANGQIAFTYTLPAAPSAPALSASAGAVAVNWTETALPNPDFSMALGPPTGTLAANTTVTLPLQITAIGNYDSAVSLVCLAPVTCSVFPASVLPGATATVSLGTGALDANSPNATVQVQGADAIHGLQHQVSEVLNLPGFTMTPADTELDMTESDAPNTAVAITLAPFNGFTGAVTFTATLSDGTALPTGLTLTFNPNPLPIGASSGAVTTQFTVTALPSTGGVPAWPPGGKTPWPELALTLAALTAWLVWSGTPRRRLGCLVFCAALSLACGGGEVTLTDDTVTVNSYDLTLTAVSNGLQATAPFTLTISSPAATSP